MIETIDILNVLFKEQGFAITDQISDYYFRFANGQKKYVVFIDGNHLIVSNYNHYRTNGMLNLNFNEPDSLNRLQKFIEQ